MKDRGCPFSPPLPPWQVLPRRRDETVKFCPWVKQLFLFLSSTTSFPLSGPDCTQHRPRSRSPAPPSGFVWLCFFLFTFPPLPSACDAGVLSFTCWPLVPLTEDVFFMIGDRRSACFFFLCFFPLFFSFQPDFFVITDRVPPGWTTAPPCEAGFLFLSPY